MDKFEVSQPEEKPKSEYKTIYLTEEVIKKIDKIAGKNNTSFNYVVVSMINFALKHMKEEEKQKVENC